MIITVESITKSEIEKSKGLNPLIIGSMIITIGVIDSIASIDEIVLIPLSSGQWLSPGSKFAVREGVFGGES